MKVGDLVKRKPRPPRLVGGNKVVNQKDKKSDTPVGIILKEYIAGNPSHWCADVMWSDSGKVWQIGKSLLEVINENRR